MNLNISHDTHYTFDEPVFLEPHHFYFHPSTRSYFIIEKFSLSVSPTYQGLGSRIDAENNIYHQCWFLHPVKELEIKTQIALKVLEYNPFDFLIEKGKNENTSPLEIYLHKITISDHLLTWSGQFEAKKNEPISFLIAICSAIHDEYTHTIRYESTLLSPDECFNSHSGSCRDLSWLMIQLLRYHGFPARFVSGYAFNPELEEGHELHAWVEAWLPGAGWVGADPSAGLLTTNTYIPVAASHHPKNTFPVQGSFRGKAQSAIQYDVKIEVIE